MACTTKTLPVAVQEAAVKILSNLSRHPANRTALYKAKLSGTHRQFMNDVLAASGDLGLSTEYPDHMVSTAGNKLMLETSSRSVTFKLTMDQLFGLMTSKFRVGARTATVPEPVRLEESLDTALNTSRWMESDARQAGIAALVKDRTSASLPVLTSPKQVPAKEIHSPPSRQSRFFSLPTPSSVVTAEESVRFMVSPIAATTTAFDVEQQLRPPSPVRVSHRNSGAA